MLTDHNYSEGFIVRDDCVTSLESVTHHPNVTCVERLPRNWILYEFEHELFKDPDFMVEGIWQQKMEHSTELRQAVVTMREQQRALLAPWYAKKKKVGDADAIIPSERCIYRVSHLTPMKWIKWEPLVQGWGLATQFTLSLHMKDAARPTVKLKKLLEELVEASGGDLELSRIESEDELLKFRSKRSQNTRRWLAGLWVLLSDSRLNAGVDRMAVTEIL